MSTKLEQADGLEIVEVADGFVVYQTERDRVHYFNHTAALVLTWCDGTRDIPQITELLGESYELPQPPLAEVQQCIDHLREEGLVR
jgi:hypothetical protein